MEKNNIGLAGEFYTLAQLTERGFIATLTLGNSKGIDILVTNQNINKIFKVEVKTTVKKPRKEKLFSDKYLYTWAMSKKHEFVSDENLIYCFVYLEAPDIKPKFFIVPSKVVSGYVKWQHNFWLNSRKYQVKDTNMRNFRIEIDDPQKYHNNWELFF